MTELLEQAFNRIRQAPADVQDAIARRLLDELHDEKRWDEQFAKTTDEQWQRMAEQAESQIASEPTYPIEDLPD
jgi:hypothetical protein